MASDRNTGKGAVLAMDLGGTKVSGALFSREGELIHRTEAFLEGKQGPEVGALLVQQLSELESYTHEKDLHLRSVGICVPGISKQQNRTVWAPNIPGWEAYPLYLEVKTGLNHPDIPVSIESDRNCYIMGEIWKGNAHKCSNAIFMAVGTGIGIGIVANGQIINGSDGIAGAIGWMGLERPYANRFDACGQFEFYASGPGIVRSAQSFLSKGMQSSYLDAAELSTRDVFVAYAHQDPVATKVIDQAIEYWGMAVANLVSIFNPEKIILGGGVFGPAIQFVDRIYKEAKNWAQPISIQQVRLETSALKGDAGLIGAGYVALKNAILL